MKYSDCYISSNINLMNKKRVYFYLIYDSFGQFIIISNLHWKYTSFVNMFKRFLNITDNPRVSYS